MYVVHPFIFTGVHVIGVRRGVVGLFVGSFGLTYLIAYARSCCTSGRSWRSSDS
jgi:hypothetical protein